MSIDFQDQMIEEDPLAQRPLISDEDLLKAVFPELPRWPILVAGGVAFLVAVVVSSAAYGGGVACGPWQGAYLDLDFPYHAPLLSVWWARAFVAVPLWDRAACTAVASMFAGALACGMVSMLVAQTLRTRTTAPVTAACGSAAGSILAATPVWLEQSTGASPTPLTVLLALTGFVFLQHAAYRSAPRWLAYAGVFGGLAAANDPSFAIVFLIALLAAIGEMGGRVAALRIIAPMAIGFLAAASIPVAHAMMMGETAREFLVHALNTTFPAVGEAAPRFAFGAGLNAQFAWPVLGAAAVGLLTLFVREMRSAAVTWAAVFLAMGPFWPALTNQHRSPYVLCDEAAAAAMAHAGLCVAAAWAIAGVAGVLAKRRRGLAVAGAVAAAVALAVLQYRTLPARGAMSAEVLARGILGDCAPDTALVVGDARTASLLRTMQIALGERPDVAVIPVHAFEQPQWRKRYVHKYAGVLRVPDEFPPVEAWKRWPLERPNEFTLLNVQIQMGNVRDSDFIDLMLWEFMRDNFAKRPVCFATVSSPWLTARGQRNGVVLRYPRDEANAGRSIESAVPAPLAPRGRRTEFDKTLAGLLAPLAEASRRQGDPAESARIAELARGLDAVEAGVWLAAARAAARGGQRDQAIAFTTDYIRLAPSERDMQVALDLIAEDLNRNALAAEFDLARSAKDLTLEGRQRREEVTSQLWDLDEVNVLADAYAKAIDGGAGDLDTLYEGAAAAVQLGEFGVARQRLGKAADIDALYVWKQLQIDGRFFLLEADQTLTVEPPGISG